jgi:hypothetical protein
MPTQSVQISLPNLKDHLRRLSNAVNMLLRGAHNEVHDVTMTNGVALTRYPAGTDLLSRITPSTVAVLVPTTLNAATLLYQPIHVVAVMNVGFINFQHAATANLDQDFKLILFGD